jgi:hypothetical protein
MSWSQRSDESHEADRVILTKACDGVRYVPRLQPFITVLGPRIEGFGCEVSPTPAAIHSSQFSGFRV